MKILIIEDNPSLSRNLAKFLELKKIKTEQALDGKEGYIKASTQNYDAIILDINLPSMNGLDICQKLREKEKNTPIIMLTSRSSKNDIISGLDTGADDYLSKPFDYDILLARIKTLTKRNLKNKSTIINIKNISINLEKIEVTQQNNIIKLTSLEFELLKYLAQNKGRVIDRKELYEKVWGEFDDFMFSKTVDVYIGYLRKKLGKKLIETKKGFGYLIT